MKTMSRAMTPQKHRGAVALSWLLAAAGAWAYHNSLSGPFIYDDLPAIVENPQIRRLWPVWEALSTPSETPVDGRPVVNLTLAINYALGGLQVWGYHAVNVAIHLLSGLVLFGLLRRTLEGKRLRQQFGGDAWWLAGGVTLVWIVHPLLTESVNYVIQRSELLMGLCLLATLYAVLRSADAAPGCWWQAAAVAACAAGMASKEVMVAAPLLVLLYDRTFLSTSFRDALRHRWRLYLGLAATWLVLAACLMTSTHERVAGFGFAHVTPWNYAVTQLGVLPYYLRLAVWPHPLVVDYGDWPLARSLADVWLAAVIVLGLLGWTLWALVRRRPAAFLGAWFFLMLGPTSSFLPILTEPVAERRMYLPLCAVVTLIVLGAWRVLQRAAARETVRRSLLVGFFAALVPVLSVMTLRRNEDYRSAERIWSDAVAKRPGNPRAHNNLSFVLLEEGKIKQAIAHARESLRLWPDHAEAHNNLGAALARLGQTAEAAHHYAEALRLRPDFAEPYHNLGLVFFGQGRVDEAIHYYTEAVRRRPDYAEAHNDLGVALAQQGKLAEALASYTAALRLQPDFALPYHNTGRVLAQQGKHAEAIGYYGDALRLRPDFVEAYNDLGIALARHGKTQEAAESFSMALRLNPDYAEARHNLGVLERSVEAGSD